MVGVFFSRLPHFGCAIIRAACVKRRLRLKQSRQAYPRGANSSLSGRFSLEWALISASLIIESDAFNSCRFQSPGGMRASSIDGCRFFLHVVDQGAINRRKGAMRTHAHRREANRDNLKRLHSAARIEPLENRVLLSTVTWIGLGSDTNWSTPLNWSGGKAPVDGDDVVINLAGQTTPVNINTAVTIGSLRRQRSPNDVRNSLTIDGKGGVKASSASNFTMTGGTLSVTGTGVSFTDGGRRPAPSVARHSTSRVAPRKHSRLRRGCKTPTYRPHRERLVSQA